MHMYDRVGREKLLFTTDKESSDWLTGNEGPRDGADLRVDTRTVARWWRAASTSRACVCSIWRATPLP